MYGRKSVEGNFFLLSSSGEKRWANERSERKVEIFIHKHDRNTIAFPSFSRVAPCKKVSEIIYKSNAEERFLVVAKKDGAISSGSIFTGMMGK